MRWMMQGWMVEEMLDSEDVGVGRNRRRHSGRPRWMECRLWPRDDMACRVMTQAALAVCVCGCGVICCGIHWGACR